jgi:hypothetical protein
VLESLARLENSTIQNIYIDCTEVLPSSSEAIIFDWTELDTLLTGGRFLDLRSLWVSCEKSVEGRIALPRLRERGLLEISGGFQVCCLMTLANEMGAVN